MILKSQVEWALHCCAVLAALPSGRYLSTKALAECQIASKRDPCFASNTDPSEGLSGFIHMGA
jgi:hypothetical protein